EGTGGVLDGVTIAAGGKLRFDGTAANVFNGLTVNGVVEMNGGILYVTGTQTIGGSGKIQSVGSGTAEIKLGASGSTLTLGPDLTVSGNAVRFTYGIPSVGVNNTTLVNHGLIEVTSGFQSEIVNHSFINAVPNAPGGGPLGGRLKVNHASGTLLLNPPSSWSNAGTIELAAGTLNLGSTFTTAGLGTVNRTGGTLLVTGTLDNTG